MANLRTAMDSAFWDQPISSPQTLDGSANSVPGDPFPLDAARASRALRIQQLALLGLGFPLGIIPSYSPSSQKELGSFSLQSLLLKPSTSFGYFLFFIFYFSFLFSSSVSPPQSDRCGSPQIPSVYGKWFGLVGQFRPKKLISEIKREFSNADELEVSVFRDAAKHFLDKSLYSIALCSQLSLGTIDKCMSLNWLSGFHYGIAVERLTKLSKSIIDYAFHHRECQFGSKLSNQRVHIEYTSHELPDHDITLEAAWPQLFIDRKGGYWDVPEAISLSLSSLTSDSGLRYRFGIQKNSGHPRSVNAINGEAPAALMPGLCAKAAFSYEQSKDIWRQKETKNDLIVTTDKGQFWRPAYDVRLKEPHATISAIIGGTFAAWFGGRESSMAVESQDRDVSMTMKKRSPLNADLFGSVCYTFQHGWFRKPFGDLTRFDARLDVCSASGLAKRALNIFKSSSVNNAEKSLSSPRLNLIFQQQVAGPIVFRVDSKFLLDSSSEKRGPHMEDFIYSLSYSLRLLRSGKVVAWYSPKRKEGMIELRLYEF
ncbi:hypothetical protein EZV62_009456 [Acer yangbiense]|uniref:Protein TRIGALACTOSYLDIACYLGLYCEROL 4, chloroplastic n=1 Tax=Acer yangbiense TaxID=1000413 RepID=A0A5C7I226_9ROSI|nr:hypothetical protein EZV62_009456 [Acer yangbiense]